MKKFYLTAILFVTFASFGIAQSSSSTAFSKGDNLLNAGIGIGSNIFGSGYSASLPINPNISFEKGITDEISVGGELSYASYKYSDFFFTGLNIKYSATYIGARGSYHLNDIISTPSNLDVYGGATLGYVVLNATVSGAGSGSYTGNLGSEFGYGLFVGGKYYFKPTVGVYTELGYQSLSFFNIGIAFKF